MSEDGMEVDDIQNQTQTQSAQQPCKYSRVNSNGRIDSSKIAVGGGGGASNGGTHNNEVVGPTTTTALATTTATRAMTVGGGGGLLGGEMVVGSNGTNSRFGRQWQHSSRIIRVSRASGGKDRHSKVWTAKGPRDRRVRLSVTTAIQFYDLQDRLGYDQPSKAVEWLIKAASEAINELPSLNTASFPPETPRQLSDERKSGGAGDSGDMELLADGEVNLGQQMGSKSGCSSNNSETSKGSGLSLSRSEIRVKARERTAKEKERDGEPCSSSMVNNVVASHKHKHSNNNQQQQHHHQQNVSSMAQTSSFTQLLTAGMTNLNENNNGGGASSSPSAEMGLFHKHSRPSGGGGGGNNNDNNNSTANDNQWLSSATSTTQMADYFGNGLMGLSASSRAGHIGLGSNTSSLPQVMTIASFGGGSENHHHDQLQHHNPHHHHHHSQQQQPQPHFPFMSDQHLIQVANAASGANGGGGGNEYNLSFSMSSTSSTSSALAAAGYNNRGTLQSNSPSLLPYLQRFSAATDGSSLPFFLGSAAVSSASPNVENHNHHHQQHHHQQQQHYQPPGLQLCYGDGGRQTDQKGKGKN